MKTYPWLKWLMRKSSTEPVPESPFWLKSWSNGEYFFEQTPRMRRMRQRILEDAEYKAKRIGVDRRQFLASTAGVASALSIIGCSDENGNTADAAKSCTAIIPQEATYDESVACQVLQQPDFIFDIQTHHYVDGPWRQTNQSFDIFFQVSGWGGYTRDLYIKDFFLDTHTTMTVLSGLPSPECSDLLKYNCGPPISNSQIADTCDFVNAMSGSLRMLNHAMVVPNTPKTPISKVLEQMDRDACTRGVGGWKVYPGFPGPNNGYYLDDPALGIPVIEKAQKLGIKTFCIHKGLPISNFFDVEHNQPRDIGVVAPKYPDIHFVIYHSAIFAGTPGGYAEGPYDENAPDDQVFGTNQLIRALQKSGLGTGSNIYPELGTAWATVMGQGPEAAGHWIGKLLKYFGEDNVLWGSDHLNIPTAPGVLVQSLLGFQIPDTLASYGYPQLTDTIKHKILGLNAAKVFGIDPIARKCAIQGEPTAWLKQELDDYYGPNRWALNKPIMPTTRREFLLFRKKLDERGSPG